MKKQKLFALKQKCAPLLLPGFKSKFRSCIEKYFVKSEFLLHDSHPENHRQQKVEFAQSVERWSAEREVTNSIPRTAGPTLTQGLKVTEDEGAAFAIISGRRLDLHMARIPRRNLGPVSSRKQCPQLSETVILAVCFQIKQLKKLFNYFRVKYMDT